MTVASFDRPRLEPIPFPLRPVSASRSVNDTRTLVFPKTKTQPGGMVYGAVGCLRGLCWAVVIEGALAFCAYEVWHLWRFLR